MTGGVDGRYLLALFVIASLPLQAAERSPGPGERGIPSDDPKPYQRVDQSTPPSAPQETPVDPGSPPPVRRSTEVPAPILQRKLESSVPPKPPSQFNPDPGGGATSPGSGSEPDAGRDFLYSPAKREGSPPVPADRALPRFPLERVFLGAPSAQPARGRGDAFTDPESLPRPRGAVRENQVIPSNWRAPENYPLADSGVGIPANSSPVPDRWRSTGFLPWRRYTSGVAEESPYAFPKPELWHPYRQSLLKGDLPFRGQDLFLNLTATTDILHEDRLLPVPSGSSATRPGSFDFFGGSRTQVSVGNLGVQGDLFRGATVFRPVDWLLRLRLVFNVNRVAFAESGIVSPDPRGRVGAGVGTVPQNEAVLNPSDIDALLAGKVVPAPTSYASGPHTVRRKFYAALQEAFFEKHLADLSPNYDFVAVKIGNQSFNSDFRGFIFNDTNFGARLFGNYDNNQWQYNLAVFDLREKDTNSELNTFSRRGQVVAVANLYRQDFLWKGYTAQASLHASFDQSGTHYDTNGGIVRPAPLGTVRAHRVNSYYLGWAGDGHLGRWNISHALYLATGRDYLNGLAGRPVNIAASLGALEVSYDRDWIRFKASVVHASGDRDATDGRATGFDSILDNTNFTGGPFSFYVRQGFNLAGTAVGVKQRFSLLPNLRTSKTQGQQNFVNPGLALAGLGADIELTPKVRGFLNANHVRFDSTHPIRAALLTNQVDREIGLDLSLGLQWRPLLTDNWIVTVGTGWLAPGRGYRDIYRRTLPEVAGFTDPNLGAAIERFLHSGVLATTLTY